MPKYKNKEELNRVINEGYFNTNSYEKISKKSILLEKVFNLAKKNNDDIYKEIKVLAEEIKELEKEIEVEKNADEYIDDVQDEKERFSSVINNLPMTTLAIKKLDEEQLESLKWTVTKRLGDFFDKSKIFELNDSQFKKFLCYLFRDEDDEAFLSAEKRFIQDAEEENTVDAIIESFIKHVGKIIKEEEEFEDAVNENTDNYYFLVKRQLNSLNDERLKEKTKGAYEFAFCDVLEKDPIELIDKVPYSIRGKIGLAYVKHGADLDLEPEDEDEGKTEDEEWEELVEEDEEKDDEIMDKPEQIARQSSISEALKELYIIKRTKDIVMLESSHILKDVEYKKELLNRTLLYEEACRNDKNKKYCEKLNKMNLLVECLFRTYLPVILE